jgi:hypothetical protein
VFNELLFHALEIHSPSVEVKALEEHEEEFSHFSGKTFHLSESGLNFMGDCCNH